MCRRKFQVCHRFLKLNLTVNISKILQSSVHHAFMRFDVIRGWAPTASDGNPLKHGGRARPRDLYVSNSTLFVFHREQHGLIYSGHAVVDKKLSRRSEATRCFVSFNILLSHSRSFEMTPLNRASVSPYWYSIVTVSYLLPVLRYSASNNGLTLTIFWVKGGLGPLKIVGLP